MRLIGAGRERRKRVRTRACRARGAFSLLEALIASVTLAMVVLAVGAAVSAGRMQSVEAEKAILGTIAADDLLSEIVTVPYAQMDAYDGLDQPIGALETLDGVVYPETFWQIGRAVTVKPQTIATGDMGVDVTGKRIVVWSFDEQRVVASVETFVPEP